MQNLRTNKVILSGLLAVAALSLWSIVPERAYRAATHPKQREKESKNTQVASVPVVDFSSSLPPDPAERALRIIRNSRYDKRYPVRFDQERPDTTMRLLSNHWWVNLPAIPAKQSDLIVICKIENAKAYLSNDKTGVYSEFSVSIENILKNHAPLSQGYLVVEREGGAVRLEDSRVIASMIAHQKLPLVGRRYVMFLKYDSDAKDYHLVTAYELHNGQVAPLDNAEVFTAYQRFTDEAFVNAVRAAID